MNGMLKGSAKKNTILLARKADVRFKRLLFFLKEVQFLPLSRLLN
jgi:hypothetical protein